MRGWKRRLRVRFLCDEEKRQLSTNLAATSALIMICCRRTHVPLLTSVGSFYLDDRSKTAWHFSGSVRFKQRRTHGHVIIIEFRHSVAFTIISFSISPTCLNARCHRSVSVCSSGLAVKSTNFHEGKAAGSLLLAPPVPKLIPNGSSSLIHPRSSIF